jgi:hypothetical protein
LGNCADLTVVNGTFVGTAGNNAAYFDIDNDGYIYFGDDVDDPTNNPTCVENLLGAGQGNDSWIAMQFRTGDDPEGNGGPLYGARYDSLAAAQTDYLTIQKDADGTIRYLSTGTTNADIDNQFVLLPGKDTALLLSHDDSANEMDIFRNLPDKYTKTVNIGHTATGSDVAFHIFSDGLNLMNDNNKRFYGFSCGTVEITNALADDIYTVLNANDGRTYAPLTDCSTATKLSECLNVVEWEFWADNYSGSGDILNEATPASGVTQGDYDFTNTSLEFVAASGGDDACWYSDGDSYAELTITAGMTPLYGAMDYEAAAYMFFGTAIKTAPIVDGATWALFGNAVETNASTADETGLAFVYDAANAWLEPMAAYENQSETHACLAPGSTLATETEYRLSMLHMPYDSDSNAADSQACYINSSTKTEGISNNFASAAPYTNKDIMDGKMLFGAAYDNTAGAATYLSPNRTRFYGMYAASDFMTEAMITRANTFMATKIAGGDCAIPNFATFAGSSTLTATSSSAASGMLGTALMDLQAFDASSYSGSGQTWTNLGTGGTAYDYYLGNTAAVNGNDPSWTSASPSYFTLAGDHFEIATQDTGTTFLQSIGKDTDYTFAALLDLNNKSGAMFGTASGSTDGTQIRINTSTFTVLHKDADTQTATSNTSPVTGNMLVIVSHDESADKTTFWVYDGTTDAGGIGTSDEVTHTDQASMAVTLPSVLGGIAGGTLEINTGDVYAFALWDSYFSNADADALRDEYETLTSFDLTQ